MKTIIAILGAAALVAASGLTQAYAQDSDTDEVGKFGVGLALGTTGATVEAKYALSKSIGLRGNFNFLTVSLDDQDIDDVDYTGDLDLTTFGAFVDFAPFKNGFVLSGGAFLGDKGLDLEATPNSSVQIGDVSYSPSEVGTLTASSELSKFSPYAGLGYDSFIAGSGDWSFNARAGVMFTGSPTFDLTSAGGALSNNQDFLNELDAEIQSAEEETEDYKYYPVLTIGLTRRF